MKQLILWKEVDVKEELPPEGWVNVINYGNVLYKDNRFYFIDGEGDKIQFYASHWLKRIVVPIYDDQEIRDKAKKLFPIELIDYYATVEVERSQRSIKCEKQEDFVKTYTDCQEELLKALQEEVLINSK